MSVGETEEYMELAVAQKLGLMLMLAVEHGTFQVVYKQHSNQPASESDKHTHTQASTKLRMQHRSLSTR